jgi:hypothetical protein
MPAPRICIMKMSRTAVFGVAALLAGCALVSNSYAQMEKSYRTLADVQAAAAKYNSVISVPPLETEPAGLEKSVKDAIAKAQHGAGPYRRAQVVGSQFYQYRPGAG